MNSDLTLTKSEFSARGNEIVENIIGNDKINMIIGIYNPKGNILYKNENAEIFKLPYKLPDTFQEWEDVETKDYLIKYLTVLDKSQNRIIRVGMILNQSLLRWRDLNQRILLFVSIILLVITIISFFLSYLLFRPVKMLAEQVTLMGEKIEQGEFKDLRSWFDILGKDRHQNDEFQKLITSLDKLAKKITETQSQTRKWSALMAHELKTPMTILRNSIDELINNSRANPESVFKVEAELIKLEAIITDFLEWASLENDNSRPELHVLNIAKRSEYLVDNLRSAYPGCPINFINKLTKEKRIFCNPIHFDQVISNILTNAIKYGGNKVEIELRDDFISIRDQGEGIPDSVLDNFGKPFNKFKQNNVTGYGLGLAWVNTIAKKYDWTILFNNQFGTTVKIIMLDNVEN